MSLEEEFKKASQLPIGFPPANAERLGPNEEKDKMSVYFHSTAYRAMKEHLQESGNPEEAAGVLVGKLYLNADNNQPATEYVYYIPFPNCTLIRNRDSVTITLDAWSFVRRVIDQHLPGFFICAWAHSHPGYGLFLSEDDNIVNQLLNSPYQAAVVWDPQEGYDSSIAIFSQQGTAEELHFAVEQVRFGNMRFHVGCYYVRDGDGYRPTPEEKTQQNLLKIVEKYKQQPAISTVDSNSIVINPKNEAVIKITPNDLPIEEAKNQKKGEQKIAQQLLELLRTLLLGN